MKEDEVKTLLGAEEEEEAGKFAEHWTTSRKGSSNCHSTWKAQDVSFRERVDCNN